MIRCLSMFERIKLTDTSVFHYTDKPPIAVAIIQKHHGISFGGICLPIDRRDKIVERVDKFEIDILYP